MAILQSLIFLTLSFIIKSNNLNQYISDQSSYLTKNSDTSTRGVSIRCFWLNIHHFAVFNIQNLKKDDGYFFPVASPTLFYNFCANANKIPGCTKESQVLGLDGNKCVAMSGSYTKPNKWELLDTNNFMKGVKITLNEGNDTCSDGKYQTIFELECNDASITLTPLFTEGFKPGVCKSTYSFSTKEACPNLDILSMVKFFGDNYIIFSLVIIILGLFELILGANIIIITIYIITSITIITIVFIFIMQFIVVGFDKPGVFWAVLVISLVVGLVLGFIIARYKKNIIGFILGGYSGYIVGTLIYSSFLNRIETTVPLLIHIPSIIVCIIVFILIAFVFFDHIIIFSTSLIGAYGIIRGIGTLIGNFPNEIVIITLIDIGEPEQWEKFLTWWVIAYLIVLGIIFVFGVAVQYYIRNKVGGKKMINKDTIKIKDDKRDYWLN